MKQILRKGLKDVVVDIPDPLVSPHHVLIRPIYSLIIDLEDSLAPSPR